MPKNNAISRFTNQEVESFFAVAKRYIRQNGLDILLAPAQKPLGRILVITSRKVGSSPERNLIRRQLKSIFYEQGLRTKGLDCIVIVKKEGLNNTFAQLEQLLIQALSNESDAQSKNIQ